MSEYRSTLERELERLSPPRIAFDELVQRRDRKRRDQRIRAAVVGLGIAIAVGWLGVNAIRSTPSVPADDRSEDLGIFEPIAGRIVYYTESGITAVDPNAQSPVVGQVPLEVDGFPLGWSSDGTELLLMREDPTDQTFPYDRHLYILHADGTETQVTPEPVGGAAISPDGERVVYVADDGMYTVDADGGEPVRIADEGESPTFSPDGTQIAYLSEGPGERVWVANADGTDAHEILTDEAVPEGVSQLTWSPAGDRLAMGNAHEGSVAIYTFAPDGSNFTKVIDDGMNPFWSPDGSQIAYVRPYGEPLVASPGLSIADADGSNIRTFGFGLSGPWHPGTSSQVVEPTPAPSGTFARANGEVLSFTGVPFETPGDLVAVNPETGEERVLVEDIDTLVSARWSADGRWVAYETAGSEGIELWLVGGSQEPRQVVGASMLAWSSTGAELATIRPTSRPHTNIAGSTVSTFDPVTGETTDLGSITEDVGDVTSEPAWSPDGTRFVFGARGGAIYSVDARTGAHSLLVRLPGERLDSVDQIVWSPDGAHIAVVVDGRPGGTYVMDADGSNVRVLLEGYNGTGIAWSPDGARLAYADPAAPVVWVASMDGSAPTEIGPLPAPCSAPFCLDDLIWSPDGSRIALRNVVSDGNVGVSAIDADGRGEAEPIDVITFASWAGGSYDCGCV